MELEELEVYNISMDLGERIWGITSEWDSFPKNTIGYQLVRAADSIAANLSEGFGRFFYKETKQFGYYSRGSLFETKTWLIKSHKRNLIQEKDYNELIGLIKKISIKLNKFIKAIGKKE